MRPYYIRKDLDGFIAHPWHYTLFSQFAWYRKLIGEPWVKPEGGMWTRMEYDNKDLCDDHAQVQPCKYCKELEL